MEHQGNREQEQRERGRDQHHWRRESERGQHYREMGSPPPQMGQPRRRDEEVFNNPMFSAGTESFPMGEKRRGFSIEYSPPREMFEARRERSRSPRRERQNFRPRNRFSGSPPRGSRSRTPEQQRRFHTGQGHEAERSSSSSSLTSQVATVREYINENSGILELPQFVDGQYPAVYFHSSSVYVADPSGNPYGPPARFSDVAGRFGLCLQTQMPVGTGVVINAEEVTSRFVQYQAYQVWPKATAMPIRNPQPEREQQSHLDDFHRKANPDLLVAAAINGLGARQLAPVKAFVAEIKNQDFGIIEIRFGPPKEALLKALFHREDVYMVDGARAVNHNFFKDKPLNDMVGLSLTH